MCPVAASHKEEMTDLALFHRIHDRICHRQYCIVPKAGHRAAAAVDSCKFSVFCIPSQFQRFFDHRGEIFVLTDVNHSRIGDDFRRKDSVCIGRFYRHQTVGRKQHRSRDMVKFFLLVLPRSAEIAFQMRILFKFRVSMGREHFPVCININPLVFRLLQQKFQIVKIMSRYDNERSFFHLKRNGYRLWVPKCFCVCLIEKFHTL